MKITCISAANIEVARKHSASQRACELAGSLIQSYLLTADPSAEAMVEVIPLIDYEMSSCRMCGKCVPLERCVRDEAFNQVFEKMIESDGLFIVVPHYAPLPSKLMILMEKMEEIAFLNWCASPDYRFPLHDRPVGVIGHGGQETSDEVLAYYQRMVVEPVAMALRSVNMRVIGAGESSPHGAAFGIQSLRKPEGSFFVDIQHDWEDIRHRITPLVQNVANSLRGPAA